MLVVDSLFHTSNNIAQCESVCGNTNITQTEELVGWLSKVANKRLKLRRQKQPDYRKEAMVEVMFMRIKSDLSEMQQEKRRRWLNVKDLLLNRSDTKMEDDKWVPNEDGNWGLKRTREDDDMGIDEFLSSMKKCRTEEAPSG